jgi:hypothetical protein
LVTGWSIANILLAVRMTSLHFLPTTDVLQSVIAYGLDLADYSISYVSFCDRYL